MIRSFLFLFLVSTAFAETPAQFAALKAQVVALQQQVMALQQNKALALAPFVTVDSGPENNVPGPNITFHGANIHIVNDMGATQLINGLGNLIIGYDEFDSTYAFPQNGRAGSHNLMLGRYHFWFQNAFASLLAGEGTSATREGCFVAGRDSIAAGPYGSILGGSNNEIITSSYSVILGGIDNLESTNWQIFQLP
jgi:hypothetical protein